MPLNVDQLRRLSPEKRARYVAAVKSQRPIAFDDGRHVAQDRYVNSKAKRNVVRTARRVGKTVGIAKRLLRGALETPYGNQIYGTVSLKNAKRIVWPTLKRLNREKGLGGVPNDVDAFLRFPHLPNEPRIYLVGAKDAQEIEKARGYEGGLKRAIIDEAASIRPSILKVLVDDIIEPSLLDYDGELDVVGTPGPISAGFFYDIDVGAQRDGWEHFFWSIADNPYLLEKSGKSPDQILAELRKRRNWAETNSTYRREYLGEWVTDSDALALHYDSARNACAFQDTPEPGWKYILAFDIGYEDADAIAVLGWAPYERKLRLVKELITRKQGITELGNQLRLLYNLFRPFKLIGDLGALGKKIGEELITRWQLPVEAADKTRKAEHVGLLDDALITGAFLAPPNSVFAEDCAIIQWDGDAKEKGLLKFDESYHSDIVDAVLYGYRTGWHFMENTTKPEPTILDNPVLKALMAASGPASDVPDYR